MVAAVAVAGLLTPIVDTLHRRKVPRALAVLVVALGVMGGVGVVAYGVGAEVVRQYRVLEVEVPEAAERLERSDNFGSLAAEARIAERARKVVADLPEQLQGGSTAEALRSAATRGVAFLVTAILTLFFVLHGPRIAAGAVHQLSDPSLRQRVDRIGRQAWRRAFGYALGAVAKAITAGVAAYVIARLLDVPGAAALGLWVGLWDIVPVVGATVGALPIVVLAAVDSPVHAVIAGLAFVAYEIAESLLLVRYLERQTLRVGPFITAAAGAMGLEAYGIGGAGAGVLFAALVAATLDEIAQDRAAQEALQLAEDVVPP